RELAAHADAERETPSAKPIERRRHLRDVRRMTERQKVDTGAEADPRRRGGAGGEDLEGVRDRLREGDVIRRPQRIEAERLDPRGQAVELRGRPDPLERDAELHPESPRRRAMITFMTSFEPA